MPARRHWADWVRHSTNLAFRYQKTAAPPRQSLMNQSGRWAGFCSDARLLIEVERPLSSSTISQLISPSPSSKKWQKSCAQPVAPDGEGSDHRNPGRPSSQDPLDPRSRRICCWWRAVKADSLNRPRRRRRPRRRPRPRKGRFRGLAEVTDRALE